MLRIRLIFTALVVVSVVGGCTTNESKSPGDGEGSGGGKPAAKSIFGQGCPGADESLARELDEKSGPMDGPRVVGGPGDLLIANQAAAFVISAPVSDDHPQRTWYEYGGIVVDAAAVSDCKQVSPDQIDEVGLVVGNLNTADFTASVLRSFRADKIEVLNDGTDGKAAVVRATGADDVFHLIEYQLIRAAADAGNVKPLSEPFGIRVEVDYTLEPTDSVLQITLRLVAETDGARSFLGAGLVTWGDALEPISRPESTVSLAGFGFDLGVPWQIAQGDEGSYAFAASDADQGIAAISGVNAFVDVRQALGAPLQLEKTGDVKEMTYLLAVSPTDANRATQALLEKDADLGPGSARALPIVGTTVDADGKPIGDAQVEIQMRRGDGEWATYDAASSDAKGRFQTSVAVLADEAGVDPEIRLRVMAAGRSPVLVDVPVGSVSDGGAATIEEIELGASGSVDVAITDDAGSSIPARLTLMQGGEVVEKIDVARDGEQPMAPGTYDVIVSRGYEYDRVETKLVVPDGGSAPLSATLKRSVDTSGWIAIDTHVHSAPSTDSSVLAERRYLDAAVTGVEVVVNTNHEVIEDLGAELEASGLGEWVAAITGQEVTASSPEHTTMYPVEPDGSVRGGNPHWYGLDLGQIYALEKERGAEIRGLNHPSGYLSLIKWDAATATPGVTDAALLGLEPGAKVWSWDFEQVELQNGTQEVLRSNSDDEGLFDFWQGAINHDKRITAVAASDAHGLDLGEVMTYVRVPTDEPARVTPEQVVEAVAEGRAILSTGAFAEVEIAGAGPGELAKTGSKAAEVKLSVQAARGIDVSKVQVFANCDLVATVPIGQKDGAVRFDDVISVQLPADANITVLGFGTTLMPQPFQDSDPDRVPRFTTNPVFVDVDGNGTFDPPGDKSCDYPR